MATTTTNYGWAIPQSTDLVKDGATAIATLGSAIDTSMNTALNKNKAGLVLLNTTSFSGVSSQSFNNVFSATYDTYRIFYNTTHSSNSETILRLRASGTDASGGNYEWQRLRGTASTVSTVYQGSQTSFNVIVNASGTSIQVGQITLFDPFKASATYLTLDSTYTVDSASLGQIGGRHNISTSYDGFTLIPTAGNMTGSVSVFGVNK